MKTAKKNLSTTFQELSGEHKAEVTLTLICTLSLGAGFFGSLLGWLGPTAERVLYILAYLSGGYFGLRESLEYLAQRKLNVDVLMILAAIGAALIGEWLEGAILLFLFSTSNSLQHFAMGRSRREIQSLIKLRPSEALLRTADGSEKRVPVEALKINDIIVVKPGERIPIDGIVTSGSGTVDQAAITGESKPVLKQQNSEVFAATFNENGILEIKVSRLAGDTTLAKIIKMVEQAQGEKAQTQRFLDKFESKYALAVIASTIALIVIPYFFLNQPFDPVFYRAMTILVVASPCALIISTPASILSAIANAAKSGILFKGGVYLEQAANIQAIAFDKTGTLTKGEPAVTNIVAFRGGEDEVLRLAASAEEHSEHHLAGAILEAAKARNLLLTRAENVRAEVGKGISARVDGAVIRVGNEYLFESQKPDEKFIRHIETMRAEGKTVVFVGRNDALIGAIALADQLREQAKISLKALRELGIEDFVILTGDSENVASGIAKELGIAEFSAGLLPHQKVEFIKSIAEKKAIAMVGDGINDAPALAASHLGVAMGAAGTDVALETADVVLMSDDLSKLPYMIRLARRARTIVWQNIAFSLAVIVMLVSSVFLFELPLTLGVIGHEGSTLLVVLNGLRLLRTA